MSNRHGLLFLCGLAAFSASAADSRAMVRAKETFGTLCVTCHGADGVSVIENYPNLAGQKATYVIKQLRDFRDGNRKDPVMNSMAAPLDDEVIKALAEIVAGWKTQ